MKIKTLLFIFMVVKINSAASQCMNDVYTGFGGTKYDRGTSIITDSSGNAFIAGTFVNAIQLGAYSLSTIDSTAMFLCKLSPSGNVVWAKKLISGFQMPYNTALKINNAGQLVVAGTCDNNLSGFDTLIQPFTNGDIFIAKFNLTSGILENFQSTGNHGYSWITDIETDFNNNVFITGGFIGIISFGSITMSCTGTTNTFVVKFNSSGQADWAKRVTNSLSSGNRGDHIGFDGNNHIYVSGWYGFSCDFGNANILTSISPSNGYLAKFDTLGNINWARTSAPGKIYFHQVIKDTSSVTVVQESPSTFINYNQYGDTIWTRVVSNNSFSLFRKIIFHNSSIFATGVFYNSVFIDGTVYSASGQNIFIACFSQNGLLSWERNILTSNTTSPADFAIDNSQNLCMTGAYFPPDTIEQTHALPVFGNAEVFYIKLCNGAVSIAENENVTGIIIYPNPATNELIIQSTAFRIESIDVYDVTGKKILHHTLNGENNAALDLQTLSPGIYFIALRNEKNILVTRKMVKI